MPPNFSPSEAESALVERVFAHGEPHRLGVLTGDVALDLFSKTNLPVQVLSDIWTIADKDGHGWLSPAQTAVAVRLIGWAQVGVKATPELLEKAGPLAHVPDVPVSRPGPSKIASSAVPPLAQQDKAKFLKLFLASGPVDGLINGDKALEIFAKSKLPTEKLSQIWELSDTQRRGALDSTDFAISMHLIQGLMHNQYSIVPDQIPSGLYEAAAEPTSPMVVTPSSPSPAASLDSRRLSAYPDLSRRSSRSGSTASQIEEQVKSPSWDIPSEVKAFADRQFDALDPLKNGFIHDNISLPFLLESKLPPEELARIWALADLNNDGKLTRDGFAIALFLIDERRRGNPLPSASPSPRASDIPPRPEKGKQRQYPPEKTSYTEPSGDSLLRRASVIYPSLPASNNHRFSTIMTPNSPGPFVSSINSQDAITNLTSQVREMQTLITQLRVSHVEKATTITNLTQENVSLRVMVEDLQLQVANDDPESQNVVKEVLAKENEGLRTSMQQMQEALKQLQMSSSDVEMQRIQYEDLVHENERLAAQVAEMRESTTQLPWSGGDSELQTLINEEALARECEPAKGMGYEEQQRLNAELVRDNERLQEAIPAMQTKVDTQRREIGQLSREIDRLKTQLRTSTSAGPSGRNEADVPPPAYDEVDVSLA
ncbi:hypothetical protein B0H11DRAFT_2218283 [Mycena galericulata]|nr:hypothetical protein B0H11DRAFT_2218283 [Mycena galericulata]